MIDAGICPKCGREIGVGEKVCPHCLQVPPVPWWQLLMGLLTMILIGFPMACVGGCFLLLSVDAPQVMAPAALGLAIGVGFIWVGARLMAGPRRR